MQQHVKIQAAIRRLGARTFPNVSHARRVLTGGMIDQDPVVDVDNGWLYLSRAVLTPILVLPHAIQVSVPVRNSFG